MTDLTFPPYTLTGGVAYRELEPKEVPAVGDQCCDHADVEMEDSWGEVHKPGVIQVGLVYRRRLAPTPDNYRAMQTAWLSHFHVGVGSRVKIVAKSTSGELGWDDGWDDEMDGEVGKTGVVKEVTEDYGIIVEVIDGDTWSFPFHVLAPVEEQPKVNPALPRFFVDERGGCIAVRDRTLTDPEYPGLHHDTEGVVWYRHGTTKDGCWSVDPKHVEEAKAECTRLNDEHNHPPAVPEGQGEETIDIEVSSQAVGEAFAELTNRQSKKDYQEGQTYWVAANSVTRGTRVKVLSKANEGDEGWPDDWVNGMTETVGTEMTVSDIDDVWGIELDGLNVYPFFVLEIVQPPTPAIESEITGGSDGGSVGARLADRRTTSSTQEETERGEEPSFDLSRGLRFLGWCIDTIRDNPSVRENYKRFRQSVRDVAEPTTTPSAGQEDDRLQCEAGCRHYTGGDVRHHPSCKWYPESLTKMQDDQDKEIERLTAENAKLLTIIRERTHRSKGCICENCVEDEHDTAKVIEGVRAEVTTLTADLGRAREEIEQLKEQLDGDRAVAIHAGLMNGDDRTVVYESAGDQLRMDLDEARSLIGSMPQTRFNPFGWGEQCVCCKGMNGHSVDCRLNAWNEKHLRPAAKDDEGGGE